MKIKGHNVKIKSDLEIPKPTQLYIAYKIERGASKGSVMVLTRGGWVEVDWEITKGA